VDLVIFSSALAASSVLVGVSGHRFRLPGGMEISKSSEDILNKTGKRISNEIERSVLRKKITQANVDMQPEYFKGLQCALPVLVLVFFAPLWFLTGLDVYWAALPALAAYFIPGIWLDGKVKKRIEAIKAELPDFCVLLGTALSSGADLNLALEQVSGILSGELAGEVRKALKDMATGDSRTIALNKMAGRCGVPELTGLVRKIQQAYRYGGKSLEPVVRHHAEKMQARQKNEVQKIAGELTIKLLFPIVIFIFFPLLVLLLFPLGWNMLSVFD
jgi:Flp pilus assembly protein TadB